MISICRSVSWPRLLFLLLVLLSNLAECFQRAGRRGMSSANKNAVPQWSEVGFRRTQHPEKEEQADFFMDEDFPKDDLHGDPLDDPALRELHDLTETNNTTSAPTEAAEEPAAAPKPANNNTGCVTREDPRASSSMFGSIAAAGTPCSFGSDSRDEGSHCVMDPAYGSFGWCWTDFAVSSWGSCAEGCPLAGHAKILGKKLDRVQSKLQEALQALAPNETEENSTSNTSNAAAAAQNATVAVVA